MNNIKNRHEFHKHQQPCKKILRKFSIMYWKLLIHTCNGEFSVLVYGRKTIGMGYLQLFCTVK